MKIKSRGIIRKSDKNKIMKEMRTIFGDCINQYTDSKFETVVTDDFKLIYVDGKQMLMEHEGKVFPTVRGALVLNTDVRKVVVDKGAVKFVINGADIMNPGIVRADNAITAGDLVIIVEEQHEKPIAVGKAIINGTEMEKSDKGKAIKSLSYVGDSVWNLEL